MLIFLTAQETRDGRRGGDEEFDIFDIPPPDAEEASESRELPARPAPARRGPRGGDEEPPRGCDLS